MSNWRDVQLANTGNKHAVLLQETYLLNFLEEISDAKIFWHAPKNNLFSMVELKFNFVWDISQANTVVIFNVLNNLSIEKIQNTVSSFLQHSNIKYFYVGINRYAIQANPNFSFPDSIEDSLDYLLHQCDNNFKRISNFKEVSGNFLVFSHPMDLYTLCR